MGEVLACAAQHSLASGVHLLSQRELEDMQYLHGLDLDDTGQATNGVIDLALRSGSPARPLAVDADRP
jgi:hypothetical protein